MSGEYKNWIQGVFDRSSKDYGIAGSSYFDKLGADLVSFAHLVNNERVLDVATGKGAVLKAIAEKFNGQGEIHGIDLSHEMIKEVESFSICKKYNNIYLKQMDAEQLRFADNYFDTIFCAFGLFFFPNPERALQEFNRTLKNKGRVYFSIWDDETSLDIVIQNGLKKLGATQPILANNLTTPSLLIQALEQAGFNQIQIKSHRILHVYDNAEEWWNSMWSHAFRGFFEQLNHDQLDLLKQNVSAEIQVYKNEQGQLLEEIPVLFLEAQLIK